MDAAALLCLDDKWYIGKVVEYNEARMAHKVLYKRDDVTDWLHLHKENVQVDTHEDSSAPISETLHSPGRNHPITVKRCFRNLLTATRLTEICALS